MKTHRLGYRIPEFEDSNLFKTGGILAIGCSFTFGDGVEAEQTFSYLTAEHFNLQAYNYGVCGYSYASIILQLEDLDKRGILKKLKPSLVLLGAGNWLIRRSQTPIFREKFFRFGYAYIDKQENQLQLKQPDEYYSVKHFYEFIDDYFAGTNNRRVKLTFLRSLKLSLLIPRIEKANADRILFGFYKRRISPERLYDFVIYRILKILKKYKLKLVVLWMPLVVNETPDGIRKIKGYKNVFLVNGLEALKKKGIKEKYYNRRHPTVEAHTAYAKGLIEAINKHSLLEK